MVLSLSVLLLGDVGSALREGEDEAAVAKFLNRPACCAASHPELLLDRRLGGDWLVDLEGTASDPLGKHICHLEVQRRRAQRIHHCATVTRHHRSLSVRYVLNVLYKLYEMDEMDELS